MSTDDLSHMIASAVRAGIEWDEEAVRSWLSAVQHDTDDHYVTFDARSGVFGHRVAMLDFDETELAHFRRVGAIVEIPDEDDVETALALSGSAAQSKIQTFPGDCDFFERVNIKAPTFEAACQRLGVVIRNKALARAEGPGYKLMEVKFGEFPETLHDGDTTHPAGASISWKPEEVEAGGKHLTRQDGTNVFLTWEEAADHPGWCKLDWIFADLERGELVNASNMIDATWEAPDGSITPLDGYLDPYFQEIYLDTDSVPLFTKVIANVSADALDSYVEGMEAEVAKHLGGEPPNVGKAAKRMYNIFRMKARYREAAFLRELFDEPANVLYQIYSVIRTIEEASQPDSKIPMSVVESQLDTTILQTVSALEGVEEQEIVAILLHLRADVTARNPDPVAIEGARMALLNIVNNFFSEKLNAMPEVREYISEVTKTEESSSES